MRVWGLGGSGFQDFKCPNNGESDGKEDGHDMATECRILGFNGGFDLKAPDLGIRV